MTDKSYVTVEQHVCVVCGKPYDTGAILMDMRMRPKFDHTTITNYGLCPDDQKKHEEDFLALVGVSNVPEGNKMKPEEANRTGEVVHVRREVARKIFNVAIPNDLPMMFVEPGVIQYMKQLAERAT